MPPIEQPAQTQTPPPYAAVSEPIFVIKRHPIGLIFLYIESLIAIIALIALGFVAAPDYLTNLSDSAQSAIASGTAVVIGIMAIFLAIATVVYRRNEMIVSDHDLEEVNQNSLLARKVSRLEMNDVEDVNCEQKGLLQTVFGFGKLTIETAGARDNFVFIYCPRPNYYAQAILQARARFIAHNPKTP